MSSIKSYKTAKGKSWRVQYRDPNGTSHTKRGFRTKNEAQAWADKNAVNIRENDWINPNAGKITIEQMAVPWLTNITHLKPKTKYDMLAIWRNHVKPQWGNRKYQASTHQKYKPGSHHWTNQPHSYDKHTPY